MGAAGPLGALSFGLSLRESVADPGEAASPNGPGLRELERLLDEMGSESPVYLRVPPKDGRLLNLLVRMTNTRKALEVGTAHGYAAAWLGRGLADTNGHLTTIEILADRVELARKHVGRARVADRVTLRIGDAHQIVPELAGPFDFVYLNADKSGQVDYFNQLFPAKLSPGGIIVSGGAIRSEEKLKDYLNLVFGHPGFDSVTLSATMEDGFAVSYRRR